MKRLQVRTEKERKIPREKLERMVDGKWTQRLHTDKIGMRNYT